MTEPEIRTAYRLHKDAVYRFAWRMTGSTAAAEDILQECFLGLLRNPGSYDPARAPLRPFLLAMARNQALKRWRNERRWDALEEETALAAPIDSGGRETAEVTRLFTSPRPSDTVSRYAPGRSAREDGRGLRPHLHPLLR
jgi:RNA polymerase sigma factor (sigma-70 family)